MTTWIGALGILFVYFVGSMLATVLIRAAVLQVMWEWFVVPQFGLEPLSFLMASGLIATALIVQGMSESVGTGLKLWSASSGDDKASDGDDDEDSFDERNRRIKQSLLGLLMTHVLMPLAFLALGWVLKQAM